MVALKKAYADIILNTAKEAAARVMAAERKALRFEHDLRSSKDEALRMLLRLKQMIDSQVRFRIFVIRQNFEISVLWLVLMDPILGFVIGGNSVCI